MYTYTRETKPILNKSTIALDGISVITESEIDTTGIDTVVFDMGSVLVKNGAFEKLEELAKQIPRDKLELMVHCYYTYVHEHESEGNMKKLMQGYKEALPYDLSEYADKYADTIFKINANSKELFPYSIPLVEGLKKKGYKVYYLSNACKATTEMQANRNIVILRQAFDGGVFSFEVGCTKPDPKIYKIFFKKYNVNPAKAIFFDDKEANVKASEKLGMRAVQWTKDTHLEVKKFPKVTKNFEEAVAITKYVPKEEPENSNGIFNVLSEEAILTETKMPKLSKIAKGLLVATFVGPLYMIRSNNKDNELKKIIKMRKGIFTVINTEFDRFKAQNKNSNNINIYHNMRNALYFTQYKEYNDAVTEVKDFWMSVCIECGIIVLYSPDADLSKIPETKKLLNNLDEAARKYVKLYSKLFNLKNVSDNEYYVKLDTFSNGSLHNNAIVLYHKKVDSALLDGKSISNEIPDDLKKELPPPLLKYESYIEESASGFLKMHINDILTKGKSKSEIQAKIKAMDKKYGDEGSKEYNKKDMLNALICACFAVPSIGIMGVSALGGPLLGSAVIGCTAGLTGLYLVGILHDKKSRKYNKEALLKSTKSKVEKRIPTLEKAVKKEKNPEMKKELEVRLKDAKKTVAYCDKEIHKIERIKRGEDPSGKDTLERRNKAKSSSEDDDLLADLDIDLDIDFDNWSVDEAAQELQVIEVPITETKVVKNDVVPVFLITVQGGSLISKAIRLYTDSIFSHAGISFKYDLSEIYSYNVSEFTSIDGKGGFSIESIESYLDDYKDGFLQVMVIFLKKEHANKLKANIEKTRNNNKGYSRANIANIILGKSIDTMNAQKMVCSQFVDYILKTVSIDLTNTSSNLVTPKKIATIKNNRVYVVYSGNLLDFNASVFTRKVKRLMNNAEYIKESVDENGEIIPFLEVKDLAVRFDEEGALLVRNPKAINIAQEHSNSKKLFKSYKKYNNLEGMKFEVCKLWYLNLLLLKKIEKEKKEDKKEELFDLRAKVMNEFTLYLNEINKSDPSFNFNDYYQTTKFGKETIKIPGSTIKYSAEYLKLII